MENILKNKWNIEKEHYKIKEVGDGVQAFVIEVFESNIFNLKKGLGSVLDNKRNGEFTLEHSKEGRRADIVLHISDNVKIPVEVEKFGNLKAGEVQIIAYQKDWDKKYGILTDGFTWRFYNNTKYRNFTLDDLLDKKIDFQAFWSDYTKTDNYYLEFLNPEFEGMLMAENKPLRVQNNNDLFFSETTTLIEKFIIKTNLCDKVKDKKSQTELAYSYLIQFILVKVLVDSEFKIFVDDYNDKLQNIIFSLKKGSYSRVLATIRNLSSAIEKDLYRPFKEDQKFINQRLDELLLKDDEAIGDISIWLDIICYINRFNFANITNDIFGSIYENYLKELYSEENLGQFFTPPEVVDFMLEEIGWNEKEIIKRVNKNDDSLSIIDPSCGSGTFLYSATNILMNAVPHQSKEQAKNAEKLVNKNIFGLDVEEFSLYLSEMSILMRLLPCVVNEKYNNPIEKKLKIFKTKDSIAEFWIEYRKNRHIRENQDSLFQYLPQDDYTRLPYKSLIRDEENIAQLKDSIIDDNGEIKRQRFDFVIGNPPYIGYNECAKKKLLTFEMIKGNICDNNNKTVKIDLSDVYGINMHSIPSNPKKYSPKPNLYAFFIALAVGLLKEGGKMCYIIPQTLLISSDYDVIRYHLAKYLTIEKIITFSCRMFIDRGIKKKRDIATSSLILVVKKANPTSNHKAEIIHYEKENAGVEEALSDIKKSKNALKKSILQTELLENADNWNYIKQNQDFLDFYKFYKKSSEDLSCYYDHKKAKERFGEEFYIDGGMQKNDNLIVYNEEKQGLIRLFTGNNHDWKRYKAKIIDEKFIKKDDIAFPQGSQGINTHLKKYRIIWKATHSNLVFQYFDNKVISASNFALVMTSNSKVEITYLFSIFNSIIVNCFLKNLVKNENEKQVNISIKPIKSFIRIPIITAKNQHIKEQIIKKAEKMLSLEDVKLQDIVSFKSKLAVIPQRFNEIKVVDGVLLCDNVKFNIIDNLPLVKKIIIEKNKELSGECISLHDLQNLEVIDFDLRDKLKDYIDHLVFALYCNIELDIIDFKAFDKIKKQCQKNQFYHFLFN